MISSHIQRRVDRPSISFGVKVLIVLGLLGEALVSLPPSPQEWFMSRLTGGLLTAQTGLSAAKIDLEALDTDVDLQQDEACGGAGAETLPQDFITNPNIHELALEGVPEPALVNLLRFHDACSVSEVGAAKTNQAANDVFHSRGDQPMLPTTGQSALACVLDTHLDTTHVELSHGGPSRTATTGCLSPLADKHDLTLGHGTHCAGTVEVAQAGMSQQAVLSDNQKDPPPRRSTWP